MGENVLLVDDDDALRDGIADMLRAVGYEVFCWPDSTVFLANVPRVVPAVLITDMRMPILSGVELHAELRRPLLPPNSSLYGRDRVQGWANYR